MPIELEASILSAVERATRNGSLLAVPTVSKWLAKRFPAPGLTRKGIAEELIRRGIEARANIELDSRAS